MFFNRYQFFSTTSVAQNRSITEDIDGGNIEICISQSKFKQNSTTLYRKGIIGRVMKSCKDLKLGGSIEVDREGINISLSGKTENIDEFRNKFKWMNLRAINLNSPELNNVKVPTKGYFTELRLSVADDIDKIQRQVTYYGVNPFESTVKRTIEASRVKSPTRNDLFVKGFPTTWTPNQLKSAFEQHGEVTHVAIERKLDGTLYGFVCFGAPDSPLRALALENEKTVTDEKGGVFQLLVNLPYHRESLEVKSWSKIYQLYVTSISDTVTQDQLHSAFSSFGQISELKLVPSSESGYAYVRYTTAEEAARAIAYLSGVQLGGKTIVVQPYITKDSIRQFSVGSIPLHWEAEQLESLLESYGRVTRVNIRRDGEGKSTGVAFVTFSSREEGMRALEGLHEQAVEDGRGGEAVLEFSQLSNNALERQEINKHLHLLKEQWIKKYRETTIQLNNLDVAVVTEEILKDKFSSYGTVIKTFLIPQTNRGYVTFSTPEEATKVVREAEMEKVGTIRFPSIEESRHLVSFDALHLKENTPENIFREQGTNKRGVSSKWDMNHFRPFFEKFGRVLRVQVNERGTSQSFVSALYLWPPEVEKASLELDGKTLEDENGHRVQLSARVEREREVGFRDEATLVVQNISPGLGEDELQRLLSAHRGSLSPSCIASRGFVFVKFPSRADAEAAITEFHGLPLGGELLSVCWVAEKTEGNNLLLQNCPVGLTAKEIKMMLTGLGKITRVNFKPIRSGEKKRKVTIKFESVHQAQKALRTLQGGLSRVSKGEANVDMKHLNHTFLEISVSGQMNQTIEQPEQDKGDTNKTNEAAKVADVLQRIQQARPTSSSLRLLASHVLAGRGLNAHRNSHPIRSNRFSTLVFVGGLQRKGLPREACLMSSVGKGSLITSRGSLFRSRVSIGLVRGLVRAVKAVK